MLISDDKHVWPLWAPDWLKAEVEAPDCSEGTHMVLRRLAKWLTVYFAAQEGAAERWLSHAAQHCDRDVEPGEVARLLSWADARFSEGSEGARSSGRAESWSSSPDMEEIFRIAEAGPCLEQYRASSPMQCPREGPRQTERIMREWADYAEAADPWVCFGSTDQFWTRRLSACSKVLSAHQQVVPSPMRSRRALTATGKPSEHSLAGTGERIFLVTEFDFARLTPRGKPTIWVPLLDRCAAAGVSVLDLNASLIAHLAKARPVWMTVYSGGKSLQAWFPCKGEPEEEVQRWFAHHARGLGACTSTRCKSQFVRMPDGQRAVNSAGQEVRQAIEFYNPEVL